MIKQVGLTTLMAAALSVPASGDIVFSENFDGGSNSMTLTSRDNSGESQFTLVDDQLTILTTSADASAATANVAITDNFSVSVDLQIDRINFSNGFVEVLALSNGSSAVVSSAEPSSFVSARIRNDGNSSSSYDLRVFGFGSSNSIDIYDITNNGSTSRLVNLMIAGEFQGNGDLLLTATLTPDPLDNPAGELVQTVSLTVASGDVDLSGTEVGFRQRIFGNNDIDTNYDNFNVDIVPEPGSLTLASLGALLCLRRRRK